MLLASRYLAYFLKAFRSLIAENLRSLGQMALKLPVVKVEGFTATLEPVSPNSRWTEVKSFSNFDGW